MSAAKQLLGSEGGRVLVFSSNICSIGSGCIKTRDQIKLYNTDQEKTLFGHTSDHDFYQKLGA
jgi:hypothetical protein